MLQLKNLRLEYSNTAQTVIDGLSFSLGKGQCLALLGPSGCGKSTLLNWLTGKLSSPEVNWTGELVFSGKKPKIRMVYQKPTLLPWYTVSRNIAYGPESEGLQPDVINSRVNELLKLVGLADYGRYHPKQMSLGMQQRVNFARALASEPDLLLLDEPFAALDLETKERIMSDFSGILKDKKISTIFVTHSLTEARTLAEDIVVLTPGPAKVKGAYKNTDMIFSQTNGPANYFDEYE